MSPRCSLGPFEPLPAAARAASLRDALVGRPGTERLWVFAYGSLLWRPGFDPAERRRATLAGYRRSFCVWTVEARGTPERPGLGLGLVPAAGERCEGVALALAPSGRDEALAALWEREMLTGVYRPAWLPLATEGGGIVALAFVVDRFHPQHAGELDAADAARCIARARGRLGPCRDYLLATVRALAAEGIEDAGLSALVGLVAPGPAG